MIWGGQPGASAVVLTVTPRDTYRDLPLWYPRPPRSGWTPATVFAAAQAYADGVAESPAAHRRAAKVAYTALIVELPLVKRAELLERLGGLDRWSEVDDLDVDLDAAPF